MIRVSSRHRLVSWDAVDSSFGGNHDDVAEESQSSRHETTESSAFYSPTDLMRESEASIVVHENKDSDRKNKKHWMRRRKRDRKSIKSLRTGRMSIVKNVEIPKTSPFISPTEEAVTIIVSSQSRNRSLIQFDDLIDDLHLSIFSFLDLSSLRSVMSINRHHRKLMRTNVARNSLWMIHCERVWHIARKPRGRSPLKFVDNFSLPMAVTSRATTTFESEVADEKTDTTNFSLLLSLTPTWFPTSIDEDSLKPQLRLRRYIQQTIPAIRLDEENQLIRCYQNSITGQSIVRYTGNVGQGDRCIRTNFPLPRPSRRIYSNISDSFIRKSIYSGAAMLGDGHYSESYRPLLVDVLRYSIKSMTLEGSKSLKSSSSFSTPERSEPSSEWIPFVVPFVDQSDNDTVTTVNITPRFVSYFEVSILENSNDDDVMSLNNTTSSTHRPPSLRTSYSDCVAVGVATKNFHFQSRMPGWDLLSFGYHGDDGGIFHSSGGMLKQFGPKYGPGDTVGCGIDYVSKGIFYTLNGAFLGYAWERVSDKILLEDLFPVVGIDTNSPIHLNFGSVDSGAFQFDLSNFIKKHEKIISSIYSFDRLHLSDSIDVAVGNIGNDTAINNCGGVSLDCLKRRQRKTLVGKRNNRGG
mmetsp:Transcript_8919/g.21799  ORF Transcript_8919/g.21799 Transcript_8919/m.21799 type:complete len:635 (+) Transcript_8919:132-2036(+)